MTGNLLIYKLSLSEDSETDIIYFGIIEQWETIAEESACLVQ